MDLYHERANLMKVLAHPVRLQILDVLRRDAECVCHLSATLRKPQPYISQQLAVLRTSGLIADEKEGTNVFYKLVDTTAAGLLEAALGSAQKGSRRRTTAGCICPKCREDAMNRTNPQ
jgi:DNA-binding transcriptional ArsR family regulator